MIIDGCMPTRFIILQRHILSITNETPCRGLHSGANLPQVRPTAQETLGTDTAVSLTGIESDLTGTLVPDASLSMQIRRKT